MLKPTVSKVVSVLSTLLLALFAFAVAIPVEAQSRTLKVNVPFGFESGTTHFAPGAYQIHLDGAGPVIRIEGQNSSAYQMTLENSAAQPPDIGKLVFHRYGSQYVLKEIWVAGSTAYLRTPKSKVEKRLEAESAQNNQNQQGTLALVATRQ
jgi:hypothetical protein